MQHDFDRHDVSMLAMVAMQVDRVADLLLSLADQDNSLVVTDGWSLEHEWDELVALGISVLIGASGLVLWYCFG